MADQRKATDGTGKGVEEDSMGGRASNNYKPKMPGRGRGARAGVGGGRSDSNAGQAADGAPKKIPKWKI